MFNVCFDCSLVVCPVKSVPCSGPFIAASETTSTKAAMEVRELGLVM
jgi:hypothetical protein